MSSVVGVFFLCSYRDYKDCSASNSEKRTGGRPAGCGGARKKDNESRSEVQCCRLCGPVSPSRVVHPSFQQITFMSNSDRGHPRCSLDNCYQRRLGQKREGMRLGKDPNTTAATRPYISRLIKHKADAGTGKATESMEGCVA